MDTEHTRRGFFDIVAMLAERDAEDPARAEILIHSDVVDMFFAYDHHSINLDLMPATL